MHLPGHHTVITHHHVAGDGQVAQREAAVVEGIGLDLDTVGEDRGREGHWRRHRGHPRARGDGVEGEPEPAADGKLLDVVGAR